MFNPYILLGLLVLLIGSAGGGYWFGHHTESNACQADKVTQVSRAIEQATELAKQDAEVSQGFEQQRTATETESRRLDGEIKHYVTSSHPAVDFDCGLDADGLRLWNSANAGYAVDTSGQRDAGLPGSAAGAGRKAGDAAFKSQGSIGLVPPVSGIESGQKGAD